MHLKRIELSGFKSFAKKSELVFTSSISAVVGPNGSGKSNIAEAFRFVLGEQSIKSMRGKKGEDLIWGGSEQIARGGRASVKVIFDNTARGKKKLFDVDFDEVSMERVVHRDGTNQYLLNDSQVRLRDIAELLAGANIGSSGHHIISQGEADRILRANPKERREMIEDGLGLRVFQYKLNESERKLQRTKENIDQVQALRKEIAPHLKFLKRQVEKIEKTLSLRDELKDLYKEYLKREDIYLNEKDDELKPRRAAPEEDLQKLEKELEAAKISLEKHDKTNESSAESEKLDNELQAIRAEKDTLMLDVGRLLGQITAEEKSREREKVIATSKGELAITRAELHSLREEIERYVKESEQIEDVGKIREMLQKVGSLVRSFIASKVIVEESSTDTDTKEELKLLVEQKADIEAKLEKVKEKERDISETYESLRKAVVDAKDESREAERQVFSIRAKQQELRALLSEVAHEEQELSRVREAFERELTEGNALIGTDILSYKRFEISKEKVLEEGRDKQETRARTIEKIKLRLEEAGGGQGDEVMKEYEEVQARDSFFEKEIADLEKSALSLREIINNLEEKLSLQFHNGVSKINDQFQNFFSLMFGGGNASLRVVKAEPRRRMSVVDEVLEDLPAGEAGVPEEEEPEEGIEVKVSLPRKKIRGLEMLSGGERALTSIALLFAMSQVNPPPFLILDETDAALDEANSRRYGDMIESLSEHSQLILITHNRETMRRAGVLYGVTMGRDSVSKLLSVQFDEAEAVSK